MDINPHLLPFKILIVDDESIHVTLFERYLKKAGYSDVLTCSESTKVISLIENNPVELVLLDLNMPIISGYDLLIEIRSKFPDVTIIIISGGSDFEAAINCMKNGAYDYIIKPIIQKEFISRIQKAIKFIELASENKQLKKMIFKRELKHPQYFENIITKNEDMISIFRYLEAISKTTEPVLITGDTGVGKELFAEAFYKLSNRKGKLIKVNIAGLDDQMFSDTIFGHKKGAFTGAVKDRVGLIEKAGDGVLFLDEIGDLSKVSQIKLLRLIQEKEYYQLGSDTPKYSNALLIVATNKDLHKAQEDDSFRRDLYYRLNTHNIKIPTLKRRIEDLELVVNFFLDKFASEQEKKTPTAPRQLFDLLRNYHFPGNIRELRSMVYEAVSLHESGILSMSSFIKYIDNKKVVKSSMSRFDGNIDNDKSISDTIFPEQLPSLKKIQEQLVFEAMKRSNNNQVIAARMLGISRQAISKRVNKNK